MGCCTFLEFKFQRCSHSKREGGSEGDHARCHISRTRELRSRGGSREVRGGASSLHAVCTDVVVLSVPGDVGVGRGIFRLEPGDSGIVGGGEEVAGSLSGGVYDAIFSTGQLRAGGCDRSTHGGGRPGGLGDVHQVACSVVSGARRASSLRDCVAERAIDGALDILRSVVHNAATSPATCCTAEEGIQVDGPGTVVAIRVGSNGRREGRDGCGCGTSKQDGLRVAVVLVDHVGAGVGEACWGRNEVYTSASLGLCGGS